MLSLNVFDHHVVVLTDEKEVLEMFTRIPEMILDLSTIDNSYVVVNGVTFLRMEIFKVCIDYAQYARDACTLKCYKTEHTPQFVVRKS